MKDWIRAQLERFPVTEESIHRGIPDEFPDGLKRRTFVAGLGVAAATAGLVVPIPIEVGEKLNRAELTLRDLSTQIDEGDLADPQSLSHMEFEIGNALSEVTVVLNDNSVVDGRVVDDIQRDIHDAGSVLPGISSAPPSSRTARRISALVGAVAYYSTLQAALGELLALRDLLDWYETEFLYYKPDQPPEPLQMQAMDSADNVISKIPSSQEELSQTNAPGMIRLLPALQSVVTQLGTQKDVFSRYIAIQRAYLVSGQKTEVGARKHEQSNLKAAEKSFIQARNAAQTSIRPAIRRYALQSWGLTLGQYQRLFKARQDGLSILVGACDPDVPARKRQAQFNRGLDRLFEARAIVTSGV